MRGQAGTFCKNKIASAGLITEDLVLHLDAGDSTSYPGTGSLWTDIINGYNATLNGAVYSSDGGGSIYFDGSNDYAEISHNVDLNPVGGAFTINMWVRYEGPTLSSSSVFGAVYQKGAYTTGSEYDFLFRGGSLNGFYHRYRLSSGGVEDLKPTSSEVTTIDDGGFHLFTIVIDPSESIDGKCYIDGVLVGQLTTMTKSITTTDPLYLGRYVTIYGEFKMAEFMIYKGKGLTQSEVTQNFDAVKSRYGY